MCIRDSMTMDEMRPILPAMDEVGYYSVECWGGATFDSCIRFLDEDPWDRLRILRKEMPNTKLQMLFRGQNMLGYRHYAAVSYTHLDVYKRQVALLTAIPVHESAHAWASDKLGDPTAKRLSLIHI